MKKIILLVLFIICLSSIALADVVDIFGDTITDIFGDPIKTDITGQLYHNDGIIPVEKDETLYHNDGIIPVEKDETLYDGVDGIIPIDR